VFGVDTSVINPADVFRPGGFPDIAITASADPLLLLPLRLEYRIVKSAARHFVIDTSDKTTVLQSAKEGVVGNAIRARMERVKRVAEVRREQRAKRNKFRMVRQPKEDHIWFRWFPDSNFAEDGVAAPTAEEQQSLEAFLAVDGSNRWPDLSEQAVNRAWQTLAANVGLARAVHLIRTRGAPADQEWGERVGRIAALPEHVALFSLKGETLEEIGRGGNIPANTAAAAGSVSYAPTMLHPDDLQWLTDFDTAVENGMGVKITDKEMVKSAMAADWIIAVGIHKGQASGEIEALIKDQVANGSLEFLTQDAPTNNSPSATVDYRTQSADVVGDTTKATHLEAATAQQGAAILLAHALKIEPQVLQQAINSGDGAFADAQAMLWVVGPALLDEALDGKTHLTDVSETEFLDAMAAAVCARGALSPMRFGDNAYGVATITDIRELKRERDASDPKDRVETFMMEHASGLRMFYPWWASSRVPVIEPDDPRASEKLEEILKLNRVSTRLDVGETGSSSTKPIGCPYVSGGREEHKPGAYLNALRREPIHKLANPTAKEHAWPMLYRLARLTLTRNTTFQLVKPTIKERGDLKTSFLHRMKRADLDAIRGSLRVMESKSVSSLGAIKAGSIAGIDGDRLRKIRVANQTFSAALGRLADIAERPQGVAQLETLMLEVFDLFQYRLDAWATGLAYSRLQDIRLENRKHDLFAGYYGMLGRLRPAASTGRNDGYLQAPTPAHATSAAIMRAAYLRHRSDGAFAVNLRSGRATRALKLLERLRKGLGLGEALGLRAERWLRDNQGAGEILPLRLKYPLSVSGAPNNPTAQRCIDGLALLEAGTSALMPGKQQEVHTVLDDEMDALADLITAEAVHQRALGAGDAAAAWLGVLSGGSVPGKPAVLKTQRYGHGSDHRVSLLLPVGGQARSEAAPRTLGDANFAAMAAALMPRFAQAYIEVRVALVEQPETVASQRLKLADDLGMTPVDLVIGGLSEVKTRAGHLAKRRWMEGQAPYAQLGDLPISGTAGMLQRVAIWDFDSSDLEGRLGLIARAEGVRQIGQRARPLDAVDLNAAADPAAVLDELSLVDLLKEASQDLAGRADGLAIVLGQRLAALTQARQAFFSEAFALMAGATALSPQRLALHGAAVQARWGHLQDALWNVAGYGMPEALRIQSVGDMLEGLREAEERIVSLEDRLGAKRGMLTAAVAAVRGGLPTESAAGALRGLMRDLEQAIRGTLDGEAFPLAPVYTRRSTTTPLLEPHKRIATALQEWAAVRKAVRSTNELFGSLNGWKAYPVAERAVAEDDADESVKVPETEEPPVRHFGLILSSETPTTKSVLGGFVIDDWTEQRPSMQQEAAIAVNYDTPQSEAPNCLLLCVPPTNGLYAWTDERAAQMVRETIAWMKTRALDTHDHLVTPTLRPGMNRVAYAGSGAKQTRRIPTATFWFKPGDFALQDAQFAHIKEAMPAARTTVKLSSLERTGFTRIKE
jgi:hypothetical protein